MIQSPASKLSQGIALITEALRTLQQDGHGAQALGDLAVSAYRLQTAFDELPSRLCSGDTPHCEGCQYAATEISYEPYGERQVTREWRECTAPCADACPAVQAAGMGHAEQLPSVDLPNWLRRQSV